MDLQSADVEGDLDQLGAESGRERVELTLMPGDLPGIVLHISCHLQEPPNRFHDKTQFPESFGPGHDGLQRESSAGWHAPLRAQWCFLFSGRRWLSPRTILIC